MGATATVFLAQHRRIDRRVAIKLLKPSLCSSRVLVERMFSEARAAARIRHPAMVDVLDCDVHNGQPYIVMAYLEGETLAARLARSGPLAADLESVRSIGCAVAGALAAAHRMGIIHRDLKPANVFLVAGGQVKILDFGIAKLTGDAAPSQTETGQIIGTPVYMSPEQCRGHVAIDARADVYALGVMLFEMVAGRPPFVRASTGDLIIAHVNDPPPDLGAIVPDLPSAFVDLVTAMLAKAPAARPRSMAEVEAGLDQALSERHSLPLPRSNPPGLMPATVALAAGAAGDSPGPVGDLLLTPAPRPRRRALWLAAVALLGTALGWTALSGRRVAGSSPVRATASPPPNLPPPAPPPPTPAPSSARPSAVVRPPATRRRGAGRSRVLKEARPSAKVPFEGFDDL
jgi:serine/threonine-protein kinase